MWKIGTPFHAVASVILTVSLAACGSSPAKTAEAPPPPPPPINVIVIDQTVKMPEKPNYQTASGIWGQAIISGVTGAVSGIFAGAAIDNPTQYKAFLETNKVDVGEIVLTSFKQQLAKPDAPVKVIDAASADTPADATLVLEVTFYGIHPAGVRSLVSSSMTPQLAVEAKLMRPNGEEAWDKSESYKRPGSDEVAIHSMSEYEANPQLLKDGYAQLSDLIAQTLVKEMAASKADKDF